MPVRVVIFEDLEIIREYLREALSTSPDILFTAAFPNARDLLKRLEATRPDVVLMDIQMPGITGVQATRIIKEKFPEIQVLMQTVLDEDDQVFNAICAGASGYLLKNTLPEKIVEAIQEVMTGGVPFSPVIARKVLNLVKLGEREPAVVLNLSQRELEVLTYLAKGMTYKQIADACFISTETVKSHIKSLYPKLHVKSKSEAIILALKHHLV